MVIANYNDFEKFNGYLMNRTLDKLSGRDDNEFIYGYNPSSKFIIGVLSPKDKLSGEPNNYDELNRRSKPKSVGLKFLLKKDQILNSKITLKYSFDIYYRVFPDYDEQKNSVEKFFIDKDNLEENEENDNEFRLVKKFKKETVMVENILLDNRSMKDSYNYEKIHGSEMSPNLIINLVNENEMTWTITEKKSKNMKTNSESEEHYKKFLSELLLENPEKVVPNINWDLKYRMKSIRDDEDIFNIEFILENTSVQTNRYGYESKDLSMFNVNITVKVENNEDLPFKLLKNLEYNYKYDTMLKGFGLNCYCEYNFDVNSGVHLFETNHTPIFTQKRLISADRGLENVKFDNLIQRPIVSLKNILSEMNEFLTSWDEVIQKYKSNIVEITETEIYKEDKNNFVNEIKRFEHGIEILSEEKIALKAFKDLNKTYQQSSKHEGWRLFQIIFIVMNVGDLVDTHVKKIKGINEKVDLIYFPTGGGKTEAFLGVSVFMAFLDRYRGKGAGTTAFIRFPLRLLSVQQMQRALKIFSIADLIREENEEIKNSESFSVGYLVGGNNIPNKYEQRILDRIDDSKEEQNQIFKEYRAASQCPYCNSKTGLVSYLDKDNKRLKHECGDCGKKLNIFTIDSDVFENIPTFVVSTLDKITLLGMQKNMKSIFGYVKTKCNLHGYRVLQSCDNYDGVRCGNENEVSLIDPPSILIHDEIHLVKEGLGSYASQYETLLFELINEIYRLKYGEIMNTKVIAATATISNYEKQCWELYQKNTTLFPSRGPLLEESFYSKVSNKLNRNIIGIMPRNKTPIFVNIDILKSYFEIMIDTYNEKSLIGETLDIDPESLDYILKYYEVMLSYTLNKKDGNQLHFSVENQINFDLKQRGENMIFPSLVTGDKGFDEVLDLIENIENRLGGLKDDEINLLIATNMISHGVDLELLNMMVFRGMPRNTAEYIQSFSRIGRTYPGNIFLSLNHARERDTSYYPFFVKFHEYIDNLVEPVALDRWSSRVFENTINGIIYGVILNILTMKNIEGIEKIYMANIYSQIKNRLGDSLTNMIFKHTINALGDITHNKEKIESDVKDRIEIIDNIIMSKHMETGLLGFIPNLSKQYEGMKSLRNTDRMINVGVTPKSYTVTL